MEKKVEEQETALLRERTGKEEQIKLLEEKEAIIKEKTERISYIKTKNKAKKAIIGAKDTEISELSTKIELVSRRNKKFKRKVAKKRKRITEVVKKLIDIDSNNKAECENELQNMKNKVEQSFTKLVKARTISKNKSIDKSVLSTRISEILDPEDNPDEFKEDSVFRTYDNKIAIIDNNQGKVTVQMREKEKEREDFLYWWNGMELCGWTEEKKWCFSVYFENVLISSVEVEGSKENLDRLIRRGNNIYLSVYESGNLYKFEFEEDKLVLSLLGNIVGTAISLLEHENAIYVGTNTCILFKIQNKTTKEILETKRIPADIQILGDELKIVDSVGNCYIYSLSQNKVLKEINVGYTDNTCNFLAEEYIVKSEKEYLTVFDWKGKQIKKIENPTGDQLAMLTKIEGNTVLSNDNGIVVFNHSTLELTHYEGKGVFYYCTNC